LVVLILEQQTLVWLLEKERLMLSAARNQTLVKNPALLLVKEHTILSTACCQENILKTLVFFLVKKWMIFLVMEKPIRMLEYCPMKAVQTLVVLTSMTPVCFRAMEMHLSRFINCLIKKLVCFLVKILVTDMQAPPLKRLMSFTLVRVLHIKVFVVSLAMSPLKELEQVALLLLCHHHHHSSIHLLWAQRLRHG